MYQESIDNKWWIPYDVALITLDSQFDISLPQINPICLPKPKMPFDITGLDKEQLRIIGTTTCLIFMYSELGGFLCPVILKLLTYRKQGMGYVVDTKLPQVLQEQKVVKISGHECFQKRNPSYYPFPAWLGYGACFVGSNTAAR